MSSAVKKKRSETCTHGTPAPAPLPRDYVASLVLVAFITGFGWLVKSFISPVNLAMLYLLAVVIVAFRRGLKPAIFTAVIGVLAFDFFFIPPYLTFRVSDTEYLITFAGMIIVGLSSACLLHVHTNMLMQPRYGKKKPGPCMHFHRILQLHWMSVQSSSRFPNTSAEFSSGKVCSSFRKETDCHARGKWRVASGCG